MAADIYIYYLPFYFQAVKDISAKGSGIRMLSFLIPVFVTTVVTGSLITAFGHYVPFMWLGAAVLTVGCGLLHTLNRTSNIGHWFTYELIAGAGFGAAFQIPYTVVQVVLSTEDKPMGNALVVFFQALGGALAISGAQNILTSRLERQLQTISSINSSEMIAAGATEIPRKVPSNLVGAVRKAYNVALSRTYILPIAAAGSAFLCSLFMEWRTVEKSSQRDSNDEGD